MRSRALREQYARAARSVSQAAARITSGRSAVRTLRGIGEKIAERIQDILDSSVASASQPASPSARMQPFGSGAPTPSDATLLFPYRHLSTDQLQLEIKRAAAANRFVLCAALQRRIETLERSAKSARGSHREREAAVVEKLDYNPVVGGGVFSILMALLSDVSSVYSGSKTPSRDSTAASAMHSLTERELGRLARAHAAAGVFESSRGGHLPKRWSSWLKGLETRGYIRRCSNGMVFLSDTGAVLARKLRERAEMRKKRLEPVASSGTLLAAEITGKRTVNLAKNDRGLGRDFLISPGWELVTLIDNREVRSRRSRDYIVDELRRLGLTVERRSLLLGDATWVARPVGGSRHQELVVGYIMERKTIEDLVQSLDSGRLVEQRTRLARCGLDNVTYIIEGDFDEKQLPAGASEARAARELARLVVGFGFNLHRTKDTADTVWVLGSMTRAILTACRAMGIAGIRNKCSEKVPAPGMPFDAWNQHVRKTRYADVGGLYGEQLRMLGLSLEQVEAVAKTYPTTASLVRAYRACENRLADEMSLLCPLRFAEYATTGEGRRVLRWHNFSHETSARVRDFFRCRDYRMGRSVDACSGWP